MLISYSTESKAYRLFHRASNKVIQSYHVKFIERRDSHPSPLFPGRVIDNSPINDSSPTAFPIAPAGPSVEDEDDVDDSKPTNTSLPLRPLLEPAGPTPTIVIDPPLPTTLPDPAQMPAPDPTPTPKPGPHRSPRSPSPSRWRALLDGVEFTSRTDLAVAESKQAARNLKERQDATRDERRRASLELRDQLHDPNPTFTTPPPPTVNLETTLANLPFANEEEISMFNEALAASLTSPLLNTDCPTDPSTLSDALASPDALSWHASIQEELSSLRDMQVYKLVPRSSVPTGRKVLRGKWVFRLKRDEHGNPVRFKSRLVTHSFEQVFGQDYVETTSPTPRMESLRFILHLAAINGWDVQQIDVKTTYLYGELPVDETVYMEQPEGFAEPDKEDWVWLHYCW